MKSLRKQKKRFSLKEHKSKDNSKKASQALSKHIRQVIMSEGKVCSIIDKVGGINNAKRILAKIPEYLHSMKIVKMNHYDPVFRRYWYVTECKKTKQKKYFACYLGDLQGHPDPNPPKLISLNSLVNLIKEIEENEQPKI